MAKVSVKIGYAVTEETSPGIWEEQITVKRYYADLIRNSRRLTGTDVINDNVEISNEFSIVSDPYARQNFHAMRYIEFMGSKWKVSSVDVQYPRLVLNTGGLYNNG